MDLSSLDVDVLLYLMKFLHPDDRLNLLLSGILKGFENVEGTDLRQRIEGFGIELGLCRDGTCQLEIRSLTDETFDFDEQEHKNGSSETCLIILERLVDRGFFQNNRQMVVKWDWPSIPGLFRIFRSMAELEKVNLFSCSLTRTDHLPQLFRSCPKLIELHLTLYENPNLEMNEELKNELRSGFQRLRLLELRSYIYPPQPHIIQEIFTWLKECAQLTVWDCIQPYNYSHETLEMDDSLRLDPDWCRNLRYLRLDAFSVEFIKWILLFCRNIHTLTLNLEEHPKGLTNEIVGLKELKDLYIGTKRGIHPKEIIRNCRQVEILRLSADDITLGDLTDLEHYENLKEVHLCRLEDSSVKEALPILERCTNLRRITLTRWRENLFPSSQELCDFIMELEHLTFHLR